MDSSWQAYLKNEFLKPYFVNLKEKVREEYQEMECYPEAKDVFNCFKMPLEDVRVVIIGQDPYINPGEAHGYAFSVFNKSFTPSLKNIDKEMRMDVGEGLEHGNLEHLVAQGVFLLNRILTVRRGISLSHKNLSWETFTLEVIRILNAQCKHIVFILWGNYAKGCLSEIDQTKHLVLMSSHPSPLGAHYSFFGSKPFSKSNAFLSEKGYKAIKWGTIKT